MTNDRSSPEFADYLLDVAARYPEADTIHLVMDNLSSHTRKAVVARFGPEAGALAVELVHRALHSEARQLVKPGGDRDQLTLPAMLGPTPDRRSSFSAKETRAWNRRMNRDRVRIQWSFTRTQARKKFGYKITRSRY